MTVQQNTRIVLAARPDGHPRPSDFAMEQLPVSQPASGQVLVRVHVLSLDPYMRGRMNAEVSYAEPVGLGDVMLGGAVGEVIESANPAFDKGDFVEGALGWQSHALADGAALRKIDPAVAPISTALGVLGMPGMAAYFGMLDIGQPQAGQTVVVSGAAGAVGALAGQIARIRGCRVVGIVRGPEKAAYLRDLGFDEFLDYAAGMPTCEAFRDACPEGVDIYFDNIGGELTDRVLEHINTGARIVVCGQSALYNATTSPMGPRMFGLLVTKQARAVGFLSRQFLLRWPEAMLQMAEWLHEGRVRYREDIVEGLEHAPQAFIDMLHGGHVGKRLVQLSIDR